MEAIKKQAEQYWNSACDNPRHNKRDFLRPFETIESELQKLKRTVDWNVKRATGYGIRLDEVGKELKEQDKEIGKLKQDRLDLFGMLAQRTKRIDALEEHIRLLRSDLKYLPTFIPAFDPKTPVPTDRHGKPEGGLEPGDVINAVDKEDGTHHAGLFHHIEESVCGLGTLVFAYWKQIGEPSYQIEPTWRLLSEVTFEFRPRFSDQEKS